MTGTLQILSLHFEAAATNFRVDRPRRQLSGLLVPWGEVAFNGYAKWKFQKDSLTWSDESRVKLLRDHNIREAVGKAIALESREDGLYGTFSIARGEEGDRVLSLAEDGVLDGFSIGPEISDDSWQYSSEDRTVRLVTNAPLRETTVTAMPAFDNARVKEVRQMADTKEKDAAGTKPTVLENEDSAINKFQADLDERFKAFADKVAESQEQQAEQVANTIAAAFDSAFSRLEDTGAQGRGEAAAARWKVISEPPVYRFTGGHGSQSMVKDAWAYHIDRDHDARDRLRKFQQQQADLVKFATVTTSNAADVIPPGYRPDLYVTQIMQGRPIVAQVSRGTITDATPFTVPTFGSATGATADHVEGVNPTDGTLNLDTITVTPGAISGVFKLTREIIDAANPAIDAIAMAAMRESWNRQTEQKAYAELNVNANVGVSTDTSLAAVVDDNLDTNPEVAIDKARDLLAQYPFTRFAAPTGAVIGQAVTRAFANAKDTTGRPLLPSVGAQNTAGIGNAVQQGWFVDGLPFVPAWAMTQNVGDELALILNRQDVWAWESPLLTFRFEEKSGPAMVELALFGYYATKVLRPAGIFSLRAVA